MSDPSIVVIGASGQVAGALKRAAAAMGVPLTAYGRADANITDLTALSRVLAAARPALVVNAAAYTAVDKAESDEDSARDVNTDGPARLAVLCEAMGAALVHLSTDYVFNGKGVEPYREDAPTAPLNVYGLTKAAGEEALRAALERHIILRTAWVYSPGGSNFLRTMLRLGEERDVVRVVADQRGTPTSADDIARVILTIAPRLIATPGKNAIWGTYHITALGETTWHGFAEEIFRLSALSGHKVPRLEAITTAEFPTPAARPAYSVLDTSKIRAAFDLELTQWQAGVAACLHGMKH